ncbi:MAG TPA: CotH kinase family protein [Candidatus Kapabacteria bacterium]|nr:CotH kinase family protein [Candidatus Kapabacteria bacterium]
MRFLTFILFIVLSNVLFANNSIVINEVCASNDKSLLDEDYEASDWIEIYNTTDSSINLKDWRIYDKNDFSKAWVLPDTVIAAKSYLILFASDKDRVSSGNYRIEAAGTGAVEWATEDYFRFHYLKVAGDFDISVKIPYFKSDYIFSLAGLMLRDSLTASSPYISMYSQVQNRGSYYCLYRTEPKTKPKQVYNFKEIEYPNVFVRIKREDDTVKTFYWVKDFQEWRIMGKFKSSNQDSVYIGITSTVSNNDSIPLAYFSDLVFNSDTINFHELKVFDNTNYQNYSFYIKLLHTNFEISKSGENIFLWDNKGKLQDELEFPKLANDVSYGRFPDGADEKMFFFPATPEKSNQNELINILSEPIFSIDGGFFSDTFNLIITCEEENVKIFYTLDCSEPTENSILYLGENLLIDSTTVIRARVFKNDYFPSKIVTNSYIFDEQNNIPIVFLVADNNCLNDSINGIFSPKNKWTELEVPANFTFWNKNHNKKFKSDIGIKLHGNNARNLPQKALRLTSKSKYENSEFEFNFFGNKSDKYKRLVLHNSSNDWQFTLLRNDFSIVLANNLLKENSPKVNQVITYLNGKYYGIMHLMERIDEDFLSNQFNINVEKINYLRDNNQIKSGNGQIYFDMYNKIMKIDMDNDSSFNEISNLIDIDNFIDYVFLEIYGGNFDWPKRNIKYWSSPEIDYRWRWTWDDMDVCFGVLNKWHSDNLHQICYYDSSYFSLFFQKLIKNNTLTLKLLNRWADLLNSSFHEYETIPIWDSLVNNIRPFITIHQELWDSSAIDWETETEIVRYYLKRRPEVIRTCIIREFKIQDTLVINIDSSNYYLNFIKINSLIIQNFPWTGIYFQGIPITLEAVPKPGYEFVSWGNELLPDTCFLEIAFDTSEVVLNPVFRLKENDERTIIFNEIMYKSSNDFKCGDWVELYNISDKTIDISNWIFKDEDNEHNFTIPQGTVLNSKDYLVLCESSENFSNTYPNILNYKGNFDFGLGRPDIISLFDSDNKLIDSIAYSHTAPWDANADGTGYSLELNKFNIDNNNPLNWYASLIYGGTPGAINSEYVSVEEIETENDIYFTCYPNPLNDYSVIEYGVPFNTNISINIYDLLGNKIKEIYSGLVEKNRINFSTESLAKGVYFIKLEAVFGGKKVIKVLQVVK